MCFKYIKYIAASPSQCCIIYLFFWCNLSVGRLNEKKKKMKLTFRCAKVVKVTVLGDSIS